MNGEGGEGEEVNGDDGWGVEGMDPDGYANGMRETDWCSDWTDPDAQDEDFRQDGEDSEVGEYEEWHREDPSCVDGPDGDHSLEWGCWRPRARVARSVTVSTHNISSRSRDDEEFQVRPAGSTLVTADPGVEPPRANNEQWRFRRWMAEEERAGSNQVIVAADAWSFIAKRAGGTRQYQVTKRFRVFSDLSTFYCTYLAHSTHRNFFELMAPATPVKLYLDIEWVSRNPEPDKLTAALEQVSAMIDVWWPELGPLWRQEVYILAGGRRKEGNYKNSYHVIYPSLIFESNTGVMRRFVQHLARQECFRVHQPDGKVKSMIDPAPYASWQPFRMPLCWKLDDGSSTELALISHRCTLANLLRATASYIPPGAAPTVLDDPADSEPDPGWDVQEILRSLQIDGGHASSATLTTGTVHITFPCLWRCPLGGRAQVHTNGMLLLELRPSGVEIRCSHGCSPITLPMQALEKRGGTGRPRIGLVTMLPTVLAEAQAQEATIGTLSAVLTLDWVDAAMTAALFDECFWCHRVIQDAAEVRDILANGSTATLEPPVDMKFFVYQFGYETSPPFVIEVCRATHTVYTFAPTGSFHVGGAVLDWLCQGSTDLVWNRKTISDPLCFDPRNHELLTWANLRRRDQDLALLDGRHIGLIRHEAAILLAKKSAREVDFCGRPSEQLWVNRIQAQMSGMDAPTVGTDRFWVTTERQTATKSRAVTVGALLRRHEKPPQAAKVASQPAQPLPPLPPAGTSSQPTLTTAIANGTSVVAMETISPICRSGLTNHRIVSHNLGGLGIESSWEAVDKALSEWPAAALFQDCRVKPPKVTELKRKLARKFPGYQSFVTTGLNKRSQRKQGPAYPLAMVTLVLKSDVPARLCSSAEIHWQPPKSLDGRLQVIRVTPMAGKTWYIANVYNYTAANPIGQSEMLAGLRTVCRALMSQEDSFLVLGGDWNATEHPTLRQGYSLTDGKLSSQLLTADANLQSFLQELRRSGKACWGQFAGDGFTRRSQGRSARLDDIYVLSPTPTSYHLTTSWSHMGHDHAAVTALIQVPDPGFRRRESPPRMEKLDKKKWEEGMLCWQRQVGERLADAPTEGNVFDQLLHGIQVAWSLAPKRVVSTYQGERRPRALRHAEARHGLLVRATHELQNDQAWTTRNWNLRKAIKKGLITYGPADGGTLLQVPLSVWQRRLADAQLTAAADLKAQRESFRKSKLQAFKLKCRTRMATPRSGEIKRLMGKEGSQVQAPVRHSRSVGLRHPNGISFSLPTAAEQRWFESLNLPAPSSDVSYSYRRNTARWEITRSQSIISVNVTPLTEVYNVIQSLPPEATGCSLLQWDRLTLLHPTDARAHEETFFSWNATAAGAACTGCASTNLLPITKEVGDRVVVHYCRDCYRCCDEPDQPPIADWPFEPQAFEKNVLPPEPAFRGGLTWDEFMVLLHTRPKDKAPADDFMTYEMWQKSPEVLQRALFRALNAALEGGVLPDDWLGATIRLLVKKEGYEHLLEFLRPICLMPTKTKLFTSVVTQRLSSAFEKHGVFHPAQEGNRQRRNTRRQCLRLLGVVDLSKRKGKTLYVAYLDFRNYFNSLPIDKMLLLLTKLGVTKEEVQILRQYYQNASFSVRGDDGRKSARINLRRGVKQGDPLSPLLAAVVAEAFSRRLDLQGLGIPVEEQEDFILQLSHLFFVDDLALMAWSPETMQRYLTVVEELCDWLQIEVNMEKTEIAAFDYKSGQEVTTRRLQMYGKPLVRLAPDAAFKYLGIRLTLTGSAREEKVHVMRATQDAALQFKGHPYSPSQVHWLVDATVVSLFRYSAPFVDWSPEELEALTKEWVVAYRFAHHLPPSTPEIHFRTGRDRGGIGMLDAVAVLGRECLGVLHQCTALKDDLLVLTGDMARAKLLEWGCTNWEEFGVELKLATKRSSRLESIFCRLGWSTAALDSHVDWPPIAVPGEGAGLMSLSHARRLQDPDEENEQWVQLLRLMVDLGITRANMVVIEGKLVLPAELRHAPRLGVSAARDLAAVLNLRLEWRQLVTNAPRSTVTPNFSAGDSGVDLIGGRVRWPLDDDTHAEGVVFNYDPTEDLYEIQLTDRDSVVATLRELLCTWDKQHRPAPVAWQALNVTLMSSIECIKGHRTLQVERCQPNPFPHLTVSKTWRQSEVEYDCILNSGYDSRARVLANFRDFKHARLLAAHLCDHIRAYWFYQDLWPLWPSSKQGWWVVFTDWSIEHGEIRLQYTTLDPETEHRRGSITVDDARTIIRTMGQRAVQNWMSERELGQDPSPEAPYSSQLHSYWSTQLLPLPPDASCRIAAHAPVTIAPQQEPYWAPRPEKHVLDDIPVTRLEVDWEYDKMVVRQNSTGRILTKGSRASIDTHPDSPARKRQSRTSTLRGAGPQTRRPQSYPLETARVIILESKHDDVIPQWKEQWEKQVRWEAAGGRTLSWAVSEHLRRYGDLQTLLTTHSLTSNPAFETPAEQHWQRVQSAVVMLSEGEPPHSEGWAALSRMERWALVASVKDISTPQRAWLRRNGSLWEEFSQKDAVVYKKNWWTSGERSLIKPKVKMQVWVSRNLVIPSIRVDGQLLQEATVWKIPPAPHSVDLLAYLAAQPSTRYAGRDHVLVATDGSLRKVDGGRLMGSAAVHESGTETAAVRVGGACSSTRPELVGILLAIQTTPSERELWILVDSSSAIARLSWFKRATFRPPGYRVKDADVIYDILKAIQGRPGLVRLIKVNGHMGDLLHSEADALAVQVTSDSKAPFLYDAPLTSTAKIVCTDGKIRPWPSSVVQFWNRQAALRYWQAQERSATGTAYGFLNMTGVGRRLLGSALRDVYDWAVRDWIRLVNPILLPTLDSKVKWKMTSDPSCRLPQCIGSKQTMVHLQLRCLNELVKNTRQKAHDQVVGVLQRYIDRHVGSSTRTAWAPATVTSFWPDFEWDDKLRNLQPDGLVEDIEQRTIHVLEIARTIDDSATFDGARSAEKQRKYSQLCSEIAKVHPGFAVHIRDFIIGIRGSIPTLRWALHLSALGVPSKTQKHVMTEAIKATIEGSANVVTAWKKQIHK